MSEPGPAAITFRLDGAYTDINRHYQERGWTDGLPIVPPTDEAVREFLRWTDREPRDVLGILPPRQGEATVERIAVNAVMAGCRPEAMPVIITAIEAMADPAFNLDSVQATTHPVAPLVIVNGPIGREVGINAGYNAFGQGFQANVTIGRAVRLILMNVGGRPAGNRRSFHPGQPGQDRLLRGGERGREPWEPLQVEAGFSADVSMVTAIGCEGPHNIQDHYSNTALGVLRIIVGAMGQAGSNKSSAAAHRCSAWAPSTRPPSRARGSPSGRGRSTCSSTRATR